MLIEIRYTEYRSYVTRGAGKILYVGGPTNKNKLCGKSVGGGLIHMRSP